MWIRKIEKVPSHLMQFWVPTTSNEHQVYDPQQPPSSPMASGTCHSKLATHLFGDSRLQIHLFLCFKTRRQLHMDPIWVRDFRYKIAFRKSSLKKLRNSHTPGKNVTYDIPVISLTEQLSPFVLSWHCWKGLEKCISVFGISVVLECSRCHCLRYC